MFVVFVAPLLSPNAFAMIEAAASLPDVRLGVVTHDGAEALRHLQGQVAHWRVTDVLSVEQIEEQDGDVAQNQNNSVIVLDDQDDGADIVGDLSVDANNVVIYGDGAEHSLIEGDVYVDGNNIIVRGVRIQGAVEIVANNAIFLHCVIEGDVSISGNNAVLSACDVLGDVQVTGSNAQLTGNHVLQVAAGALFVLLLGAWAVVAIGTLRGVRTGRLLRRP